MFKAINSPADYHLRFVRRVCLDKEEEAGTASSDQWPLSSKYSMGLGRKLTEVKGRGKTEDKRQTPPRCRCLIVEIALFEYI